MQQAKDIYLGTDNFAKIIRGNGLYVDKSLLIKDIINDKSKVILITRPRCFGKTLNMSMLQYFFADTVSGHSTAGLFDDLLIAQVDGGNYIKQYQGQSPVIFVSFKDIKCSSFVDSIAELSVLVKSLYSQYEYLAQSTVLSTYDKQRYLEADKAYAASIFKQHAHIKQAIEIGLIFKGKHAFCQMNLRERLN